MSVKQVVTLVDLSFAVVRITRTQYAAGIHTQMHFLAPSQVHEGVHYPANSLEVHVSHERTQAFMDALQAEPVVKS